MRLRRSIPLAISLLSVIIPVVAFASDIPMEARLLTPGLYPIGPYGSTKTALRTGDLFGLYAWVLGNEGMTITADLSPLGLPVATANTSGGPSYVLFHGLYYPNIYSYDLGTYQLPALEDGTRTLYLSGTDPYGSTAAATTSVTVDNTPPTITLDSLKFTGAPGEYLDFTLSGHGDGTGTTLKASKMIIDLYDANGQSLGTGYASTPYYADIDALNSGFASLPGAFTNVPLQFFGTSDAYHLAVTTFKFTLVVYDGAGNTATSSITVPVAQDPCANSTCASNVLFLPGIEGSRLYRPDYSGGTDKLWEPNIDADVQDLYLNSDGSSTRSDIYAKERDVIDETPSTANIYKSFISKMDSLKAAGTINDWEPIAYDWRLSLDDLLTYGNDVQGRIYYSGDLRATSTPYIIQELKRLATTSKTGKVTIVAHSNGGLLAKRLTEVLGPAEASQLIDKMIFVAVPQAGTPAAIAAGLHGYDQEHVAGIVVSKGSARSLAQGSSMEYHLLPSASYFTYVDNPVVTFDPSLPDWISRYGATIHSAETLATFLTDSYGRVDPQTGDTDQPIQMNSALLSGAGTLHSHLDTWSPPAGVSLIQVAGWGVPTTLTGITYKKKNTGVQEDMNATIDGDGTVVTPSALWTSTSAGATNYWVDLARYNKVFNKVEHGTLFDFDHSDILEINELLQFISDVVSGTTRPLSDYSYLSTSAPASPSSRLRYALHSPLTLNLYDSQGRHTGISTTTGQVEEQVPGSYYAELGDVKYIYTSDASDPGRIIMNGYADGTFTFDVKQYSGDTLTASTTFENVPTTAGTVATIGVQSDISTLSPLALDKNGDGTADASITPVMNGSAALYHWNGFLQPVNDTAYHTGQSASVFKAGSTVPVKFQLLSASGAPLQAFSPPQWLSPQQVGPMSAPIDESVYSGTGTSGSVYKWDSTSQQYVYNWSTKGFKAGYWYKVYAKLDDGNTYSVIVGLR